LRNCLFYRFFYGFFRENLVYSLEKTLKIYSLLSGLLIELYVRIAHILIKNDSSSLSHVSRRKNSEVVEEQKTHSVIINAFSRGA
jgi:hypothetical protein